MPFAVLQDNRASLALVRANMQVFRRAVGDKERCEGGVSECKDWR